jgi:hypothetical protein
MGIETKMVKQNLPFEYHCFFGRMVGFGYVRLFGSCDIEAKTVSQHQALGNLETSQPPCRESHRPCAFPLVVPKR